MNKSVLALTLSVLAVFGWNLPLAHSAPPPAQEDAAKPIVLEVDVDELPEGERDVGPVVLEQLRSLVEDGGFEIVEDADDATLLRVRVRRMEAGDRNYGLHFEFVDGDVVDPAIEWTDCVFCTEARLLQKLEAVAPDLLAAIEARQQAEAEAASTEDEGGGDEGEGEGGESEDGGDDGRVEPPPKPIGPLGGAGIGLAVAGLGVTIAGAVQWSRGRVPNDDITSPVSEGRDYTGQGQLLVGIGAGVLVVGAVMLGVDLGVLAKKRKRGHQARILPVVGPKQAGLVLRGRF
jgi:hypothetical protein